MMVKNLPAVYSYRAGKTAAADMAVTGNNPAVAPNGNGKNIIGIIGRQAVDGDKPHCIFVYGKAVVKGHTALYVLFAYSRKKEHPKLSRAINGGMAIGINGANFVV